MQIFTSRKDFIAHSLMLIAWSVQQHENGLDIDAIKQKYLKITEDDNVE